MTTTDLSIETLETEGFVTVPLPPHVRAHIAQLVCTWQAFLALPEDVRRRFTYLPDTTNSGSGYEPPDEDKFDYKHVFHSQFKHESWLRQQAYIVDTPVAHNLVADTLELLTILKPIFVEFTDEIARTYSVGSLTRDLLSGYSECIIRLLNYPGGIHLPGDELAVQHVDKGAFTGHLYEDLPGVERLTWERKWAPFPVHSGEALIFSGMRLQYRTHSQVNGLCHRVVTEPAASRQGRNSIVLFGNFAGTPYYDKKRHGSMQVHGPGFNYGMPFEEFKKFFNEDQ